MVPVPGESASDWWAATAYDEVEPAEEPYFHDVPPALRAQAEARERDHTGTSMREPFPLAAWPDVPTHYVLLRDDRFFPPAFVRRMVRERLGIEPDEVPGGHMAMLSQPAALAERLASYADRVQVD
jgi:pimeloyl-ACP methyl ester carboxylesterase